MSVIDDYLATVTGPDKPVLELLYSAVRTAVPDATEELSYNMPTFKWRGKGLVAILSNKNFMSVYPFCNVESLGIETTGFETTKGSIHFTSEHPVTEEFLKTIIAARQKQISSN